MTLNRQTDTGIYIIDSIEKFPTGISAWAKKIVGEADLPEPENQIMWLPTSFRLISVGVGLFCLYKILSGIVFFMQSYVVYKYFHSIDAGTYTPEVHITERLLLWVMLLVIGLYFVSGAPHFVRWQVKKTLEFCKQFRDNEKA